MRFNRRGSTLLFVFVFGSAMFLVILGGVAGYAYTEYRASNRHHQRDSALHIAEAGIQYYRWHLAHNPTDYTDGTGEPGPYVHDYTDKDGNVIGTFSLMITPPAAGSTIVEVESTGSAAQSPTRTRTLKVRFGFPALTDYTFIQNVNMRFSPTTVVHGKVHSNGGIEFNGTTDASVNSAKTTYNDGSGNHPGVWGTGGPAEFFTFPVSQIYFANISADLGAIQALSDTGGIHLTSSGVEGWHLVFLADSTIDVYKVNSRNCYKGQGFYWGSWWFGDNHCYDYNAQTFQYNTSTPANGAIFSEDDVWVNGVVDGRVTIGAGKFPVQQSTYQEIYIAGNLTYEEKSSDDVLGLIAQGNIVVPYNVPDSTEINAAALSQFKKVHRPYYHPTYNPSVKTNLTFFGSQIAYEGGGWKYTSGSTIVSGFINTNHLYDGNLRYDPPPGFPVGPTYDVISWEEVL